jgi:hypothetical protein
LAANKSLILWLDDELYRSPNLIFDGHIGKFRDATDIDTIVPEITSRQDKCLDRLVDRSCSNRLDFRSVMLTDYSGNGTCNSRCT